MVSLWTHLITQFDFEATKLRLASSGLAFGVAASVSMLMAVELHEGIFVDLRLGLLAGAILADGPLAGAWPSWSRLPPGHRWVAKEFRTLSLRSW